MNGNLAAEIRGICLNGGCYKAVRDAAGLPRLTAWSGVSAIKAKSHLNLIFASQHISGS